MKNKKLIKNDHKWAKIFIEIVLRAMRRIHYEYGIWGIGRQWEMNRSKTNLINMGHGIELADERTICAAITLEFMNSPAVTGFWVEKEKKEERYFTIDREYPYKSYKTNRKVDIFIQKYLNKGRGKKLKLKEVPNPSFIEAKRMRIWYPDLKKGTAKPNGNAQLPEIKKDINKLRKELKCREILCHLLVWGIYQKGNNKTDHPDDFIKNLKDPNIELSQVRWLPIEWEHSDRMKVTKSLWIALAEVKSNKNV